jgi:anthranilate phosphoribosyltransferase
MSILLQKYVEEFKRGRDLDESDVEAVLDALITETEERSIADLLTAWHHKGIEAKEIYSIAKLLRERMIRVKSKHETYVDIVGTGGSRAKTFNVSTAVAFVVAGAGVPVAKHGNKAATSNSGSADVLSELGINPAVDPATAERCLNGIGICFMFAPNFHRLSPILGKVRRGLGFPTIFNCVGPLCNPANAPHQVIGVWSKELVPKMANALARLGTKKSWIVHGEDGLDEISLSGNTHVAEVVGPTVKLFDISPSDFGVSSAEIADFKTDSSKASSSLILEILKCEHRFDPVQGIVLINSAAALCLTDRVENLEDGVSFAFDSIRGGHAIKKLNALSAMTNK